MDQELLLQNPMADRTTANAIKLFSKICF